MRIHNLSMLTGANGPSLNGRVVSPLVAASAGKTGSSGAAAGTTAAANGGDDQAAVVRAAKDFESVLVQKLMEEMKNTIPESGLEDGASKQMQDMFWLYMGQAVGSQGGLGLWKQMVRQLRKPGAKQAGANVETLR